MRSKSCFFMVALLCLLAVQTVQAGMYYTEHKNAIVLAMFGTTVETALKALTNIREEMHKACPGTPVHIAFTSNIIRHIWQKRAQDPAYVKAHPEVPADILHVQGPLAAIANLQDAGYDTIVVQPTHIAPAEEFLDLSSYVRALSSIQTIKERFKPFHKLVIGRPALGTFGLRHPYGKDIIAAARALSGDVEIARKKGAALLYMGHGNDHFPSGGSYLEFAARMRELYPDVLTFIGTVEGFPLLDNVIAKLKHAGVKRVVLKPLMVVAGDHAMNDMAGPGPDSWTSVLRKEGFEVIPEKRGLGEQDSFARIFVNHALDAASDAGITLE